MLRRGFGCRVFSENGHDYLVGEKGKVAETQQMCCGKEVGFGCRPMKIAEASS